MDTSQTPSGIPYLAYLSGLNLGQGGTAGLTDPSLSGQTAGGQGLSGATGGLGLDQLSQLLQAQQSADIAASQSAGGSLLSGIGGLGGFGNIGQGPGYFQAGGSPSAQPQRGGPGTGIAGQTAGQIDPMAILRQALGIAQKGLGLIPNQPAAYETAGDTGVSLSDQLRSGQAGTASPLISQYGLINPTTGFPLPGTQQQPTGGVIPTAGFGEIPQGTVTVGEPQITGYGTEPDITLTNTTTPGAGITVPPALADLGVTPDNLPQFMADMTGLSPEAAAQFQAELAMGGNPNIGTTLSGYQTSGNTQTQPSGTSSVSGGGQANYLSGASGALGAIGGITGLLSAIQSGDYGKIPGGAVGAYQGLAQLLNSGTLGDSLKGVLPGISGGGVGFNPAALLGSAIQLAGNDKLGQGDTATLKAVTDTISLLQALSASTAGVPYAAIVAQAVSDAMNVANYAQGKQSLAQTAAGSVPIIGGYIQALIAPGERLAAERQAARRTRGLLGSAQEQTGYQTARFGQLDPNMIDPSQYQNYLNTLGREFQTQERLPATGGIHVASSPLEYARLLANAGVNPSATDPTGTANQAAANQAGQGILSSIPGAYERMAYLLSQNPSLATPSWEAGGGKTADVLRDAATYGGGPISTWYEHLPGTPKPYIEQAPSVAEISQGITQGSQVANPELGGAFSPEVLASPYFAQAYWQSKGVTPAQAFLYGAGQNAAGQGALGGINLPGIESGFGGYDPAALYQSLVAQGLPNLSPQQQVQAMLQQAQGAPAAPMLPQPQGPLPGANPFPFVGGGFDPTTGNPLAAAYGLA